MIMETVSLPEGLIIPFRHMYIPSLQYYSHTFNASGISLQMSSDVSKCCSFPFFIVNVKYVF